VIIGPIFPGVVLQFGSPFEGGDTHVAAVIGFDDMFGAKKSRDHRSLRCAPAERGPR